MRKECLYYCEKMQSLGCDNFKLVVIDLDGTLYDLSNIIKGIYDLEVEFFSTKMMITKQETLSVFEKNQIYPYVDENAKSATEFFARSGIDINEWTKVRNAFDYIHLINTKDCVKGEEIALIKNRYRTLLLSSNTYSNISKILRKVNIESGLFDAIICSSNFEGEFSKKTCIEMFCRRVGISPNEVISIGDRLQTDIVPVAELGGAGILLYKPMYFKQVSNELIGNNIRTVGFHYQLFQGMIVR